MIFKPEDHEVYFFWNGQFPIIVYVDRSVYANEDWYWTGHAVVPLSKKEIDTLNKAASSQRMKHFSIPRKDCKYSIVSRGEFKL
jgi:hypothetical protein